MNIEDFLYIVETNKTFEESVISVLKSVDQKSWSLFQIYDIKERMAAKGFYQQKLKIIEICSAKYANELLNKSKFISLCMPCKINVIEQNNKVFIAGMKPSMILQLFPDVTSKDVVQIERDVIEIVDNAK